MDIDDVADVEELVGGLEASPDPIWRSKHERLLADAGGDLVRKNAGDERVDVGSGRRGLSPVGMLEIVEADAAGDDVEEAPTPSAAALVGCEAVLYDAIGGLLEVEIERGVDLEAGFVHALRAVLAIEFAADFFDKPWSDAVGRRLDVEAEGGGAGSFSLRLSNGSVFQHRVDDGVAAAESAIGIEDR